MEKPHKNLGAMPSAPPLAGTPPPTFLHSLYGAVRNLHALVDDWNNYLQAFQQKFIQTNDGRAETLVLSLIPGESSTAKPLYPVTLGNLVTLQPGWVTYQHSATNMVISTAVMPSITSAEVSLELGTAGETLSGGTYRTYLLIGGGVVDDATVEEETDDELAPEKVRVVFVLVTDPVTPVNLRPDDPGDENRFIYALLINEFTYIPEDGDTPAQITGVKVYQERPIISFRDDVCFRVTQYGAVETGTLGEGEKPGKVMVGRGWIFSGSADDDDATPPSDPDNLGNDHPDWVALDPWDKWAFDGVSESDPPVPFEPTAPTGVPVTPTVIPLDVEDQDFIWAAIGWGYRTDTINCEDTDGISGSMNVVTWRVAGLFSTPYKVQKTRPVPESVVSLTVHRVSYIPIAKIHIPEGQGYMRIEQIVKNPLTFSMFSVPYHLSLTNTSN